MNRRTSVFVSRSNPVRSAIHGISPPIPNYLVDMLRVAILDDTRVVREMIEESFVGSDVETVHLSERASEWLAGVGERLLVTSVRSKDDIDRIGLSDHSTRRKVIAMIPNQDPRLYRLVMQEGLGGVIDVNAPGEAIAAGVLAASKGEIRMPVEMLRKLAGGDPLKVTPSDEEIRWLQRLSDGASVRVLSKEVFIAERTLHRLLQNLYIRLGAKNRQQAISIAATRGLLES